MSYTRVTQVVGHRRAGSSVILECAAESDRTGNAGSRRTIPVTLTFLQPDLFRLRLDANPEAAVDREKEGADGALSGAPNLTVTETADTIQIATRELELSIGRNEWSFVVADPSGRVLLSEQRSPVGPRGEAGIAPLGFAEEQINNGSYRVTRAATAFSLEPDEHIFGLGEKFTALDKRGQIIEAWTTKAHGTETERSYKNVPFYLSTRGYGILVDSTRRCRFDFGSRTTAAMTLSVDGDSLDLLFFRGPSFAKILREFTLLTGRSRIPPKWSFGLWMSRSMYMSREEVEEVADRLRSEEVPCDVIHLDPAWMRDGHSCDLEWDTSRYPRPEEMIARLHAAGYHVSLWEHPYIPVGTEAFDEAVRGGFLVRNGDGRPYLLDGLVLDQSRGGIVDFTSADAIEWWKAKHRRLLDIGVDLFKTDFGEDVPEDAVFSDGRTGEALHNLYPNLYNRTVDEVTVEARGEEESITWGRSAWTGGQRFPLYWGGDPMSSFDGMASALRGGLSLSLSGFPFWSHDIGGFWGRPTPELYLRWAQFGLLSSHARCHGTTPREPWAYGEEAVRIFRKFAALRYRLLPYLFTLAAEASRTGLPVVRPLVLEYQEDPVSVRVDTEYLLGSDLLVAPVLRPGGAVDVYLPEDDWVDFWTGASVSGPRMLRTQVPLDVMPLFVRAGSIIPMGPDTQTVTAGLPGELTLRVTPARETSIARGELFDEEAKEMVPVSAKFDEEGESVSVDLKIASRFRRIYLEIAGLRKAPKQVHLEGKELDEREEQSGESAGSWRYVAESGIIEIRP